MVTLNSIAQWQQDCGHPTYAACVDLHAAFDSLSWLSLWLLLTRLGIPDKIVSLIRALYSYTLSAVFVHPNLRMCGSQSGVRHGCVLAVAPDFLPRAWTGCWKEMLTHAQMECHLVHTNFQIWTLLTMSLFLPSYLNSWYLHFRRWLSSYYIDEDSRI